jgi:hypothetical protein
MKTLRRHASRPAARPLLADEVVEFHAGRLVLLLSICGQGTKIKGLTKMAKLDFFVRYPDFFAVVRGQDGRGAPVEAAMVRHHYGPWDKRYYHVLAFLEARGLISATRSGKAVHLSLTNEGKAAAQALANADAFSDLVSHMRTVAEAFSSKTGSELKNLIYATFGEDVSERPLGHIIGVEG